MLISPPIDWMMDISPHTWSLSMQVSNPSQSSVMVMEWIVPVHLIWSIIALSIVLIFIVVLCCVVEGNLLTIWRNFVNSKL